MPQVDCGWGEGPSERYDSLAERFRPIFADIAAEALERERDRRLPANEIGTLNLVPPDWSGTVRMSFRNGRLLGEPELAPEIISQTIVASPSRKSSRQSRRKASR